MTRPAYEPPFPVTPLTYGEALGALHGILRLGISPMLETVEEMLDELGRPDRRMRIVQVAGTNGKTSTSRYTAAILRAAGLRTALYTSPELVHYTERMEVDGAPVHGGDFGWAIAAAQEAGRRVNARREAAGLRPYDVTEFDTLTVAALALFARLGVEAAVLEVGMGGRWDATTATEPEVTCVTGIGLDHTHILGRTHAAIAAEKAAIVRRGQRACVLGPGVFERADVAQVLLARCREQQVPAVAVLPAPGAPRDPDVAMLSPDVPCGPDVAAGPADGPESLRDAVAQESRYRVVAQPRHLGDSLVLEVAGPTGAPVALRAAKPAYQAQNIACAVALAQAFLGRSLEPATLARAVAACPTPGRFHLLQAEPPHLVDACHNPQSVQVFLQSLRDVAPDPAERPALLCAVLADKDAAGMVGLLAPEFPCVHVTATDSPRALPARELADLFRNAGATVAGVHATVAQAAEALAQAPYVACGSITLAGALAGLGEDATR